VGKINTEDDYREALKRFLELTGAEQGTPEEEELFHVMQMMEDYERENCS